MNYRRLIISALIIFSLNVVQLDAGGAPRQTSKKIWDAHKVLKDLEDSIKQGTWVTGSTKSKIDQINKLINEIIPSAPSTGAELQNKLALITDNGIIDLGRKLSTVFGPIVEKLLGKSQLSSFESQFKTKGLSAFDSITKSINSGIKKLRSTFGISSEDIAQQGLITLISKKTEGYNKLITFFDADSINDTLKTISDTTSKETFAEFVEEKARISEEAQAQINELKANLETEKKTNNSLQSIVQEQDADYRKQLEEKNKRITALETNIAKGMSDADAAQVAQQCINEKDGAVRAKDDAVRALQTITQERDTLKRNIDNLNVQLEQTNKELAAVRRNKTEEITRRDAEIRKLQADNTELNKQLIEAQKTSTGTAGTTGGESAELKQCQENFAALEKERNETVEELTTTRKEFEQQIKDKKREIEDISEALTAVDRNLGHQAIIAEIKNLQTEAKSKEKEGDVDEQLRACLETKKNFEEGLAARDVVLKEITTALGQPDGTETKDLIQAIKDLKEGIGSSTGGIVSTDKAQKTIQEIANIILKEVAAGYEPAKKGMIFGTNPEKTETLLKFNDWITTPDNQELLKAAIQKGKLNYLDIIQAIAIKLLEINAFPNPFTREEATKLKS